MTFPNANILNSYDIKSQFPFHLFARVVRCEESEKPFAKVGGILWKDRGSLVCCVEVLATVVSGWEGELFLQGLPSWGSFPDWLEPGLLIPQ